MYRAVRAADRVAGRVCRAVRCACRRLTRFGRAGSMRLSVARRVCRAARCACRAA